MPGCHGERGGQPNELLALDPGGITKGCGDVRMHLQSSGCVRTCHCMHIARATCKRKSMHELHPEVEAQVLKVDGSA
eukprot:1921285-Alexandrium_andersonii.AAC.1